MAVAAEQPAGRLGTAPRGLVPTAMLLALLAWSPLPNGSNRPWSWSLLAVLFALLLLWLAGTRLAGRPRPVPWPALAAAALTVVAMLWIWVQTLPAALVPLAAPYPFWAEPAAAGLPVEPTIGAGAEAGRSALLRLLTYGAAFWSALLIAPEAERARQVLRVLVLVCSLYAAYGLFAYFAGWNAGPGPDGEPVLRPAVSATFANRNHFATYANLGLVAALALLLEPFLASRQRLSLRRLAVELGERLLVRQAALLLAMALLFSAMLLSESRGALLSLLAALGFMLVLLIGAARPRLAVWLPAAALAVAALGLLVWISGAGTLLRLSDRGEVLRLPIWQDTLDMIEARPWLGHGYGSYEQTFPPFQRRSAIGLVIDRAHDTYLEHAAEIGLPATALLYAGPLLLFVTCVRGVFVRRRDRIFALVGATATVLVAVHALVDFSLQIPAVAVTYAVLLGIGVAQSVPSGRYSGSNAAEAPPIRR